MHTLSPEIKTLWAISILRRGIFISIFLGLGEYFFVRENIPSWPIPLFYFTASIFLLNLIWMFIFPSLNYKFWRFDVRDNEIFLQRGIFTRVYTTAPYSRIQHIDVAQGILERSFGLGTLVLYTAGTRGADVTIPGLPIAYAESLRDSLKNLTGEDAV